MYGGFGRALERLAVPVAERSSGFIGGLKKIEQRRLRRRRVANIVIHQQKLVQAGMIEGCGGGDARLAKTLGLRGGVSVKRRFFYFAAARPEAAADALVRVGLARDR